MTSSSTRMSSTGTSTRSAGGSSAGGATTGGTSGTGRAVRPKAGPPRVRLRLRSRSRSPGPPGPCPNPDRRRGTSSRRPGCTARRGRSPLRPDPVDVEADGRAPLRVEQDESQLGQRAEADALTGVEARGDDDPLDVRRQRLRGRRPPGPRPHRPPHACRGGAQNRRRRTERCRTRSPRASAREPSEPSRSADT